MKELDSYRSGMRGLNKELGKHRGRVYIGKLECTWCVLSVSQRA